MHPVGLGIVRLHRQEGAGADMKRDMDPLDPGGIDPVEQRVGKMQAGGGGGDRADRRRHDGSGHPGSPGT